MFFNVDVTRSIKHFFLQRFHGNFYMCTAKLTCCGFKSEGTVGGTEKKRKREEFVFLNVFRSGCFEKPQCAIDLNRENCRNEQSKEPKNKRTYQNLPIIRRTT